MRLICPNCGAQYEVADDVIPEAGRDVQCSNCGHTWFEHPGASSQDEDGFETPPVPGPHDQTRYDDGEDDLISGANAEPDPEPVPEPEPEIMSKPLSEPLSYPDQIGQDGMPDVVSFVPTEDLDTDEDLGLDTGPEIDRNGAVTESVVSGLAPPAPLSSGPGLRRQIDPEVAAILREEAAREEARRRAEAQPIETQSDLGLAPPVQTDSGQTDKARIEETRRRLAMLRGDPDPTGAAARLAAGPRRDRLPDIDQINSTLRSTQERETAPTEADLATGARGFRFGFGSVTLMAAACAFLYVAAPRIMVAVPATTPVLAPYIAAVDAGRLWLDLQMQALLARMNQAQTSG